MAAKTLKSIFGLLLPFFLLFALDLFIYRYGLIEMPKFDHYSYLVDRALVDNDSDWFQRAFNYNRTRINSPGDTFLFRPALFGILTLEDFFFRRHLLAQGILSILMHTLAAYSLYLLARYLTGPGRAGLLAVLFLTQYAGMEIVLWRHISPYLLALGCFHLGLFLFIRYVSSGNRKYLWGSGACWLLAVMFHELACLTLLVLGLLFLGAGLRSGRGDVSNPYLATPRWGVFFIMPALIYLLLNGIDYLYHYPDISARPELLIVPQQAGSWLGRVAGSLATFWAALQISFFFPWWVELEVTPPDFYHLFHLPGWRHTYVWTMVIIGAAMFFALFLYGGQKILREFWRERSNAAKIPALAFFIQAGIIVVGVSWGRLYFRSAEYLLFAGYYFSLLAYVWCGLAAVLWTRIASFPIAEAHRRVLAYLVGIGCILLIGVNYVRIQNELQPQYPKKAEFKLFLNALAKNLAQNPDVCLAGVDTFTIPQTLWGPYAAYIMLLDYQCGRSCTRTPLYLIYNPRNGFWLAELKKPDLKPEAFRALDLFPRDQHDLGGGPPNLMTATKPKFLPPAIFLLSREVYENCAFAARIENCLDCGAVYNYQDADNFNIFIIERGQVYWREIRRGRILSLEHHNFSPRGIQKDLRLEVVPGVKEIVFLGNGYVLSGALQTLGGRGQVGFFAAQGGVITDARVSGDCGPRASGYYLPKIQITTGDSHP